MQIKNKFFCHWDLLRLVTEDYLKGEDGLTLSVICNESTELMIFLGKDDSNSHYEVRVYKSEPSDKYVPNDYDEVRSYEENDEYATFFFDKFEDALRFVDLLPYFHKEYRKRPVRKIENV